MGFFDKIKEMFGSEDDVEFQKTDETNNKDELAENLKNDNSNDKKEIEHNHSEKSILNDNSNDKKEIEHNHFEKSVLNNGANDEQTVIRNFEDLDDLIHSGAKKIVLNSDIEEGNCPYDGIKVDVDNLIIEGNGHIIDAKSRSRIFEITGSNVIIKSLTFKNGKNHTDFGDNMNHEWRGGAIYAHEPATFIECNFLNNIAGTEINERAAAYFNFRAYGGAVYGDCTYVDCNFTGNLTKAENVRSADLDGDSIGKDFEFYNEFKNAFLDIIEIEESSYSESKGFGYLNDLICDGVNEISLSEDIVFCDTDKLNCNGISFEADNLVIDGNNHIIDARGNKCPFNISGKNIEIKNLVFKNFNEGIFSNNGGQIKLSNLEFDHNLKDIVNNHGKMQISDCVFKNNVSFGAIIHNSGDLHLINSKFSRNTVRHNVISNQTSFESYTTQFEGNVSQSLVLNYDEGTCTIVSGKFINNLNENASIYNRGKYCIIQKATIENAGNPDIVNDSNMTLNNFNLSHKSKNILNKGYMLIKESQSGILENIDNHGEVDIFENLMPKSENFDFTYLDSRIHECDGTEIVLENDISFAKYEKDFYEGGIELDIDNLVIDGNGHTIDGKDASRIFIITANNITFKNITFKNGHSFKLHEASLNSGGAIKINTNNEISIIDCKFINNTSEDSGGAVHNHNGKLMIKNAEFNQNSAIFGGAIDNNGDSSIIGSEFNENTAKMGGAINSNGGRLILFESEFIKNASDKGGSISNESAEMDISKSTFNENTSKKDGGAIFNGKGKIKIKDCNIERNESDAAGVLFNESGIITIQSSAFTNNNVNYGGGAICNDDGIAFVDNVLFEGNASEKNGGAVKNIYGIIQFDNCIFRNNETQSSDYNSKSVGALNNVSGEALIKNSIFENNVSDDEYCGDCYNGGNLTLDDVSFKNNEKTVLNEMNLYIGSLNDYESIIENEGNIYDVFPLNENQKPFEYLQNLIQNDDSGEIILENDIVLDSYNNESIKFFMGIKIDKDIIINGNGHTIDAQHRKRIFTLLGGEISFINLRMTNGFSDNKGIITNHAKLNVRGCTFEDNNSKSSGVIENDGGHLMLEDCLLMHNDAHNVFTHNGGVSCIINCEMSFGKSIKNYESKLKIFNSKLNNNKGAISNYSIMEVSNCIFKFNKSDGAISNSGDASVSDCVFEDNKSYSGGAIENRGKLIISNSIFDSNECEHMGGAITNNCVGSFYNLERDRDKFAQMEISDCTFKNNKGYLGKAIYNSDGLKVRKCFFCNNSINEKGIIQSKDKYFDPMKIAAIYSINPDLFEIEGCTFDSNGRDLYNYKIHLR